MKFTFSIHIGAQPHYCFAQRLRLYLPWNSGAEQLGLNLQAPQSPKYLLARVLSISFFAVICSLLSKPRTGPDILNATQKSFFDKLLPVCHFWFCVTWSYLAFLSLVSLPSTFRPSFPHSCMVSSYFQRSQYLFPPSQCQTSAPKHCSSGVYTVLR